MESYNTASMIHRAALKIAGKRKPVFPCKLDKSPYTPRGFKDATTNPGQINALWNRYRGEMIGMPTGEASGVSVLDVDRLEALDELPSELRQELSKTFTVRTPSGGLHFYLNHVEGITNRTGALPAGIDMRGEGGYVIVPPSSGYTVEHRALIADAPAQLLETLRDEPCGSSRPIRSRSGASIPNDGGPIQEGTRNATLASIAGRLHDGTRDLAQLEADLQAVNESRCLPPLEGAEVQGIAKSIHRLAPCRLGGRGAEPNPEVIGILGDILKDWWQADWRGTGGKSNRDVLLAYILFAIEGGTILPNGGILVDVSHHQSAERARKSSSTAYNSHKRLSIKGWCRGGGNGPDRREDQPSGIGLLPRPHKKQRKPEHPLPDRGDLVGAFGFASLPTARRGRHSAPGLVRVASAGRIACIDHMERIAAWVPARIIADALGISRAYDVRKRYLEPLEASGIVERSGKLWRLTEGWQEALGQLFEEEEALERELYSGLTSDERQKKRREESRERWRNRENTHPEPGPSQEDMREQREGYPERRREAIEAALARLFREHPEYRGRRVGQIACRLVSYISDDFPRGPDGVPKDAEVEAILDGEAA